MFNIFDKKLNINSLLIFKSHTLT